MNNGFDMMKFYFAALVCAVIFLSYLVGAHIANIKCAERIANTNVEQMKDDTKMMGGINDTVYRTNVGNIRRILREKYTIAE